MPPLPAYSLHIGAYHQIQHFDKHAKSKGAWRLLLLDGHGSHHTLDLIEYAEAHNIVLFALPPHLTHLLQPLDVVVFQPYKHYHSRAVDFAIRSGASKITKLEFLAMIQSIRVKAFKESTILSAFKKKQESTHSIQSQSSRDSKRGATCRAVFIPFWYPPYRTEFDPIDDIEKEVFVHNLQRYVKGAISQGHELKQTMVDLYNTKLAEQRRQGRKKYKNRHLQTYDRGPQTRISETVDHFLFRCTKWIAQRGVLFECARAKIGNLSFFLGGKAASDGDKWKPDMQAVHAAIKFAIETERLDRKPQPSEDN
ncbi:DDE superfamily endonuclease [Hirsutella rhossiliensis]